MVAMMMMCKALDCHFCYLGTSPLENIMNRIGFVLPQQYPFAHSKAAYIHISLLISKD